MSTLPDLHDAVMRDMCGVPPAFPLEPSPEFPEEDLACPICGGEFRRIGEGENADWAQCPCGAICGPVDFC